MIPVPGGDLVIAVVLAVFLYRLARAPRNASLWVMVACLVLHLFGFYAAQLAQAAATDHQLGRGLAKLTQNVVLHGKHFALALFFLLASGEPAARRRARWELVPLAAAAIGMAAAMLATPAGLRDHTYGSDMTVTPIAAFYVIGSAYFLYINLRSARWAWRYAAESDWRLALGLRTAAIGVLISATATFTRTVLVVHRWLGGAQIPWVNTVAVDMIAVSGTLLLGGLLLGAVLTGLARARTWWAHRRAWRTLRPLWQALQHTHPTGQLEEHTASPRRERWQWFRVHRRYWRRYVETRDALVQLSPYLARAGYRHDTTGAHQSGTLREALRLHAEDVDQGEQEAVLIAPPAADSETDVRQLLALSRALMTDAPRRRAACSGS